MHEKPLSPMWKRQTDECIGQIVTSSEADSMTTSAGFCGQIKCVDIHRLPELGYRFGFDVLPCADDGQTPIIANVCRQRQLEGPGIETTRSLDPPGTPRCQSASFPASSESGSTRLSLNRALLSASRLNSTSTLSYPCQQHKLQDGDVLLQVGSIQVRFLTIAQIEKLIRCSGSRLSVKVCRPWCASAPVSTQGYLDRSEEVIRDLPLRSTYSRMPDDESQLGRERKMMDDLAVEDKKDTICEAFPSPAGTVQPPDELVEAAKRLAKRLYHLDGFKAGDVSFELCKGTEFSDLVAKKFMEHFEFNGMVLHSALRTFLTRFTLPGSVVESDPIKYEQAMASREMLVYMFCSRYVQCNPNVFNVDACYVLVCSLMLLNTDLHGVRETNNHNRTRSHRRMNLTDFKRNLRSTEWKASFDSELMKSLYSSIKHEPLTTLDPLSEAFEGTGLEETRKGRFKKSGGNAGTVSCLSLRAGAKGVVPAEKAEGEIRCSGWMMRKCLCEDGGKRTSRLRRGWMRLFSKLDNLNLCFYRSESHATPLDCLRIHHSLARALGQYKRRLNVFTLRLATNCLVVNARQQMCICRVQGAQYVFQTANADELDRWVFMINLGAALFSSPPFALPVGSIPPHKAISVAIPPSASGRNAVEEGVLFPTSQCVQSPVQKRQWYCRQVNELRAKLTEEPTDGEKLASLVEQEISRNMVYIECINEYLKAPSEGLDGSSVCRAPIVYSSNHNSTLCTLREDLSAVDSCADSNGDMNNFSDIKCPSPSSILKRDAVVVADEQNHHC